jgi:hypothetical protein
MKPTKTELDILEEKRNQRIAEIENELDKFPSFPEYAKILKDQKKQLVGKFIGWQKFLE